MSTSALFSGNRTRSAFTYRLHYELYRKASRNEEGFFRREALAAGRTRARGGEKKAAARRRARRHELYLNRCPRCGSRLKPLQLKEWKIDQFPSCLRVWLEEDAF